MARSWWNPFAERRTRGEWVSDGLVFGLASAAWLYYASILGSAFPALPEWYRPVDIALGGLACLALWWSRRHPVAVAVIAIVPGSLAITAGFAALASVYRVGAWARPAASLPIALAHVLFALPYHWWMPLPGMPELVWVIVIPLLYALVLSVGLLARARRMVIVGIRATARHDRERLEAELASLRHDERERIAREMHDVLAHRISLLSVHAGALEYRTSEAVRGGGRALGDAETHEAAVVIRENAHRAVEDLRDLLTVLRDEDSGESALAATRPSPTLADLPALVAEARSAGQRVSLEVPESIAGVRPASQLTAYRTVQEGLTNARKHAPRAPVAVWVGVSGAGLAVTLSNPIPPGVAQSEIPGLGAGLTGLGERVRMLGGRISHGVADGVFVLDVELPEGES